MKMKLYLKLLYSIVLLAFLINPAGAQIWLSDEDIYNEAEEFLDAEEYVEALPLYLLLEKKEIINANISYKIGLCYLNIRGKKDKSIPYLESAVKNISSDAGESFTETKAPLKALLVLGIAYRIDNKPKKAIGIFEMLKDSVVDKDPEFLPVIDMHIQFCENAILLDAFPGEPRKEKLPAIINDEFSNYNPVLVDHDSVLYYMEELKFYDAVMKSTFENGKWNTPQNLTPSIGSDGDHILVGASADGNTLFFYLYQALRAGELYVTTKGEKGWSELKALNGNVNTAYHETHASLSYDGTTLYFTSNRPGGIGGLDIYKCGKDGLGDWGPAVNLGPVVNTPYNEETPIINSDDEILYFSSQGHLSMGGYDIFYSTKLGDNKWYMPINMGAPICTTDDDLFYFPLEENVTGLMSRLEQPMSTGYDIYQYHSMVFSNTPRFNVKGKVNGVDSLDSEDYHLAVIESNTKDTVYRAGIDTDGNYELLLPSGNFNILVLKNDKQIGSSQVNLSDETQGTIQLAELSDGTIESQVLNDVITKKITEQTVYDTLELKNILFSFDNSTILPEYKEYLKSIYSLMQKYPSVVLKIEGYADALGSEAYNLKLSEKRALAVANYLRELKIEESRLKISGKGESDPIAINNNSDGTDNPQGRKYNRRVLLIPENNTSEIMLITVDEVPVKYKLIK